MALNLKCRACGRVITEKYPAVLLTYILLFATIILLLIVPTLVGFGTSLGGLAVIVGVVLGVVALFLAARAPESCSVCRADALKEERSLDQDR